MPLNYKEPALIDKEKPFESMTESFELAAVKSDPKLGEKGILAVPDILANVGGATVSCFEWLQTRIGNFRTFERLNRRLSRLIHEAYINVYKYAEKYDVSLRIGAYIIVIEKVAKTLKFHGIYA